MAWAEAAVVDADAANGHVDVLVPDRRNRHDAHPGRLVLFPCIATDQVAFDQLGELRQQRHEAAPPPRRAHSRS